MDIGQATREYEAWLRAQLPVVIEEDLEFKHQQMAAAAFPFLRATFYRWAQRWAEVCPHLAAAPAVLGVGDLHVENYGTWRDAEGRLVWGINDFDEATWLPYTVDLVRLATSALLATDEHRLTVAVEAGAEAILAGYRSALVDGGRPLVLAEHHRELRCLATGQLRDPERFWAKMQALPSADVSRYPGDAVTTVVTALPEAAAITAGAGIRSRRAGLGSLGRPRLVALAEWRGGAVAREVKALLPSAWDWARAGAPDRDPYYREILAKAVRCPDPCAGVAGRWLVRRLAPDCIRIELAEMPADRDEALLLRAMGHELANVHLGTPEAAGKIVADLDGRRPGWLAAAAQRMAADTVGDWNRWKATWEKR
ncbi:MAG TPA: DUF2252 family protein [Acidimicrobiales bacterium]|jgi:hypothetical protein|nr:DUF2252 family protein [Acidimicrobiales bacterium]